MDYKLHTLKKMVLFLLQKIDLRRNVLLFVLDIFPKVLHSLLIRRSQTVGCGAIDFAKFFASSEFANEGLKIVCKDEHDRRTIWHRDCRSSDRAKG